MCNLHNREERIINSVSFDILFRRNVHSLYYGTENEYYWIYDDFNLFVIVPTTTIVNYEIYFDWFIIYHTIHSFKKNVFSSFSSSHSFLFEQLYI